MALKKAGALRAHCTAESVGRCHRCGARAAGERARARGSRGDRRHGTVSRGEPATDAARDHGVHRRVPRSARLDEHARSRRVRAERGHRAARRRLGLDGRRLHSRHRLRRQLAVVRARRADLHRRRLSRPSARRRPGPARHRARRGAARPARHAVRQEHARRRRADHFAQTRGRRHRLHRCRHRLARPLELARLVRLRARRRQSVSRACRRRRKRRTATSTFSTTNASTGRARSAWAVPASPRARTASRSRPRRPIRRIPHGSRTPRTPTPRSAACGSAACSAPPTRAAASSTTSATRTCSRDASPLRFLASDTVEVNVVADLTYSDQQGAARQVHRATAHRPPACRPASRRSINNWNNNIAVPVFGAGGQFDGRFQTPDEYTSYHRFGQDPLTGRITPNRNELKHTGLQVDLDWDSPTTCTSSPRPSYRDFDNSFGRDSDGTPLPGTFTWDTSKHEQFTQEFQLSGLIGANDGVDWTTGFFYYDAFDSNQGYNNGYVYTSSFSDHKDEQDLTNYAVFAHFNWAITEKLSMSTGLRYTDDQKDATIYRRTGNTAPPGIGAPQFVLIDNGVVTVESEEWSPKFELRLPVHRHDDGLRAVGHGLPRRRLQPAPGQRAAAHVVPARVRRQLRDRREDRLARPAVALQRRHLLHGEHGQAASDRRTARRARRRA